MFVLVRGFLVRNDLGEASLLNLVVPPLNLNLIFDWLIAYVIILFSKILVYIFYNIDDISVD